MKNLILFVFISIVGFNSNASSKRFDDKAFEAHRAAVGKRQDLNFGSTRLLSKRQWKLIDQSQDQLVQAANRSYGNKCYADHVLHVLKRNYLNDLKKCISDLSAATEESDSIFCGGLYTDYAAGFSLDEIPKLLNEHNNELQFIEKNIFTLRLDKIKYFIKLSASCETKIGDQKFSGGIGIRALFFVDTDGNAKLLPSSEHFNDLDLN